MIKVDVKTQPYYAMQPIPFFCKGYFRSRVKPGMTPSGAFVFINSKLSNSNDVCHWNNTRRHWNNTLSTVIPGLSRDLKSFAIGTPKPKEQTP